MNIIDKIKLARGLEKQESAFEDGVKMKNSTKIVSAIVGALTLIAQVPAVQAAFAHLVGVHPAVASAIGGLAGILALLHNPKASAQPAQQGNQQ